MIAKEGLPSVLLLFVFGAIFIAFNVTVPLFITIILFVFILNFFRDPKRRIADIDSCFIAPADGEIIEASNKRITIFMSIYNVHINRIPYKGKIVDIKFRKGKYSKAYSSKAEKANEAIITTVKSTLGNYTVSQIAGFVARRIINKLEPGAVVKTGEKMGMIKFGSSVSVSLPEGFIPTIQKEDKAKAGETIMAVKIK